MTRAKCLLVIVILIFAGTSYVSAIPEPPPPPNTMQVLCSSGTCHSSNDTVLANATLFNYPNGVPISKGLIGISISNTCIKLQIHNTTSHCISYYRLKQFEKVNPLLAGKWVMDPYPHKVYPTFKGVWNYYVGDNIVMVDPPADFAMRSKNIIVQGNNFTWINPTDNATNTRTIQHVNRFVDATCDTAQVAPILSLINDTITYLMSGCTKTNYNDTVMVPRTEIPFDYNTYVVKTVDYMHHFSNTTRINDCIHFKCNLPSEPFHNHGFGW